VCVCVCVGDGTFNEVVNGLLTRTDKQRIPLGEREREREETEHFVRESVWEDATPAHTHIQMCVYEYMTAD
jgi:hypothetical protein